MQNSRKVANLATLHVTAICGRGYVHANHYPFTATWTSNPKPKNTPFPSDNDIHEAIAKTGTALAALVDEALLSHEPMRSTRNAIEELPGLLRDYLASDRGISEEAERCIALYQAAIALPI